jgi:uncharacterized protein (DUF58 family)
MRNLNVDFNLNIAKFESAMKKRFLIKTLFYKRLFKGKGLEFDSFRKYNQEDEANLIDWRASMKSNELLVRKYVEEQDLRIFFIVDVGDNMIFGSGEKLKNEVAAEIAACLAHLVTISGDSLGFALFSENIVRMKKFAPGIKQFYSFEKELKDVKVYGKKSSLKKALKFLTPYLKEASAVFIISDFINIDEECLKLLKQFSTRYETIGIMVRSPVDVKLPDLKKEVVIEDISSGKQLLIDPSIIKYEYERNAIDQKKRIEKSFKQMGSDLLYIPTDKDFIKLLIDFLKVRVKNKRNLSFVR